MLGGREMRYLLCQISNQLINPDRSSDPLDAYYTAFWAEREKDGYYRPSDFWELPLWAGEITATIPADCVVDLHIVRTLHDNIPHAEYTLFSVLDVNKAIVRAIVERYPDRRFVLGGYVDPAYFDGLENVTWFRSVEQFATAHFGRYVQGLDWRLFAGYRCIPRLTLSTGCRHRCRFCTVEDTVVERSAENILQQVDSFNPLIFRLVYLNDKTFGQAENWPMIGTVYDRLKERNPAFSGFIVQTTAQQVRKHNMDVWYRLGVRVVELGLETANDTILGHYRKPHNVRQVADAIQGLRRAGIQVICNLILGFPEESHATYANTYFFLAKQDLYGLNIYTLAAYAETDAGKELGAIESDKDELSGNRTWFTEEKADAYETAKLAFADLGLCLVQ